MNIRKIIRGLTITSVAVAAICAQTGSATAAPPTRTPPAGALTGHIPAEGTPCGAITLDVQDGSHMTTFFDRAGNVRVIGLNGPLQIRVTSDDSHRSIDLNVSGPAKLLTTGD